MDERLRRTERSVSAARARVTTAMLVMLGLVVLAAPVDVLGTLAAVRGERPERQAVSSDIFAEGEASSEGSVGVGDEVDRDATDGATSTSGRWGAPATRPTTGMVVEELRGAWRVEGGVEEAVALAVVAAHAWAAIPADGDRDRWEGRPIVTVEAVERPGAEHGVVTLLVATDDALHRIAIPVALSHDGPWIAGRPWTLPAPTLRSRAPEGRAVGDAELIAAARGALEAIGIPGDRLVSLEATDGWPFIARLDDDTDSHPWLRWHVDRFVVAGLPVSRATTDVGGG